MALIVGHGAANSPAAFRRLHRYCDVVEADVRLFYRRLEVRHAKALGPLPLYWDDGRLLPFGTRFPPLASVVEAVRHGPTVMLDLKGPDPRMARLIVAATAEHRTRANVFVCARCWRTADRLLSTPRMAVLHSVASRRQLRRLLGRYRDGDLTGVSIHERLLDEATCRTLRSRVGHLWTWPVNDVERGRQLTSWGATGLISDAPADLASLRRTRG